MNPGGEPLLVFPDPAPALLAQTLDLGGFAWKAVSNAAIAAADEPADGWSGAIIVADEDPEVAFSLCRTLRKRDAVLEPLLLIVSGGQLGELGEREDLFDDFCLNPFHPQELEARLRHLMWRAGRGAAPRPARHMRCRRRASSSCGWNGLRQKSSKRSSRSPSSPS